MTEDCADLPMRISCLIADLPRVVGRMEDWIIFFAWGGSSMCHPPVPLSEDDCAA